MRRTRRIRKVVNVTVPTKVSKNTKSRIIRGTIDNNNNRITQTKVTVNKNERRYNKTLPPNKFTFSEDQPIWKGQTVYLIGGGPSLKNFNWSSLKDKKTIAINKAIKTWPNADAAYWTDGRTWTWLQKEIKEFKGERFTIAPKAYTCKVNILKRGIKYGLETANDTLAHGNNSGYAAINLAIHLGATKIILLGYDMGITSEGSHFHDGYPVNPTSAKIYKDQFLPGFDVLKNIIKGKGIQIFNACPTSKLKAFPIITIDEALSFR
jgi:hypothetical protein